MPDYGTTSGIGIGIGQGLSQLGQAWAQAAAMKSEQRDKRADAYEKQAQDIAANIARAGGRNAPEAQPLVQELYGIVQKHNALYPMHETPALVARIQKIFGKQPGAPTQDTRADWTPERFIAAAPPSPMMEERGQFRQLYAQAFPKATAQEADQAYLDWKLRPPGAPQRTWHIYVDPNGKLPPLEVNQDDPAQVEAATKTGRQPLVPGGATGGAGFKEARDPITHVLTHVTFQGRLYDKSMLDDPNTPEFVRNYWRADDDRMAKEASDKQAEVLRKEAVNRSNILLRDSIENARIPLLINKTYTIEQLRDNQKRVDADLTKVTGARDLYDAGERAANASPKNAQQDQAFLRELLKSITTRGVPREAVEALATRGTVKQRLEDVISNTVGPQTLGDDIRENLIQFARGEFNQRLLDYNQDKAVLDQLVARELPNRKTDAVARPHTRRSGTAKGGGNVEEFGPNDWRYVRWDGKQWVDTGQKYSPTK